MAYRPVPLALMQLAMDSAAAQVRRCYRGPRAPTQGRQIVTRLRVRVGPDGVIGGLPTVIGQDGVTPANEAYAARMAQAAIESVLRCAPLRLPAGVHGVFGLSFDLTFSPTASA